MAGFQWACLAQMTGGADLNYYETLVWPGGGTIGLMIWALSFVMLALAIQFFITIRRGAVMPDMVRQQIQSLFDNKQYREAIEVTGTESSMLSYVVHAALTEAAHGYAAMEQAIEEAAGEKAAVMLRKVEWLNLIGNVAPMLGLLGTVWGMILAFMEMVAAKGIPPPDKLAYAIGIALVTTLLGLCVAIPALAVLAVMRNRIDALATEITAAAEDLIATFRPAAGKAAAAAS